MLEWENVNYEKGKEDDAHYSCADCGSQWPEMVKRRVVREGVWKHLTDSPFECFKT